MQRGKLIIVLEKAAAIRGAELDQDQIQGYVMALGRYEPEHTWNALAVLWRDVDQRSMPTPAAIIEQIRKDAKTRVERDTARMLPEPTLTDREHAYGTACCGIINDLLARRIDGAEADRRMVAAAREHNLYARIAGELGCAGVL